MSAKKVTRDHVHEILRQLEEHSPEWVSIIRAYINKLERKERSAPILTGSTVT